MYDISTRYILTISFQRTYLVASDSNNHEDLSALNKSTPSALLDSFVRRSSEKQQKCR